eukprot:COSAG06_NODE_54295_length_295_cov_0.943878_1_plen_23_part_01
MDAEAGGREKNLNLPNSVGLFIF